MIDVYYTIQHTTYNTFHFLFLIYFFLFLMLLFNYLFILLQYMIMQCANNNSQLTDKVKKAIVATCL